MTTRDPAEQLLADALHSVDTDPRWAIESDASAHRAVVRRARRTRRMQRLGATAGVAGLAAAAVTAFAVLPDRGGDRGVLDTGPTVVQPGATASPVEAPEPTGMDWWALDVDTAQEVEAETGLSAEEYLRFVPPPSMSDAAPFENREDDVLELVEDVGAISGLQPVGFDGGNDAGTFVWLRREPAKDAVDPLPSVYFQCGRVQLLEPLPVFGFDAEHGVVRDGPREHAWGVAVTLLSTTTADDRVVIAVGPDGTAVSCETDAPVLDEDLASIAWTIVRWRD